MLKEIARLSDEIKTKIDEGTQPDPAEAA